MSSIISLQNIEKSYKSHKTQKMILKDISLDFKENTWTIITGESGCGKSTLLNIIGGLDKAQKGKVLFNEKFKNLSWSYIRSHIIGIVFQSFNLLNEFSVLENVMLPALFQNKKKKEIKNQAIEYLKKFNLYQNLKQKPNTLSGGEQQRVAIARSLINNPQVIIADEPTGNLDKANTQIIMQIFQELIKIHKKTIIMVSHDPELFPLADRIIKIENSHIIQDSPLTKKESDED